MKGPLVLTVTQLTTYLRALLEGDRNLANVFLCGEVSNFKNHRASGHFYFDLKDEQSLLHVVMFRQYNQRLRFTPQDGMRVLVRGRVSVYEKSGQYQLYCEDLQPEGAGALAAAYEQLRLRLEREGLFAQSRKKRLPRCPSTVGVVTSPTGAAVHDILQVLGRRFPAAEVVLAPVLVQGEGAAAQIAAAIRRMNAERLADVLIVGRGGGSAEDLWAFNEEVVVRAVAESTIPVISAVGHETDTTLCDYAADFRAPTPSAAAECAVPDHVEMERQLADRRGEMYAALREKLLQSVRRLQLLTDRRCLKSPRGLFENQRVHLDSLSIRLEQGQRQRLRQKRTELIAQCGRLQALSPLAVLARGYAVVEHGGVIESDSRNLRIGDEITVRMRDGGLHCEVKERLENRTWKVEGSDGDGEERDRL